MTFDAAPFARPLFKERALWAMIMGLFFFLIYGSTNQISSLTAPHPSYLWSWERQIPFVPELIVPYMSSDLLFVLGFLLAPTRSVIQRLAVRCGLAIVISSIFFVIMPLQFSFPRPQVEGWPTVMFEILSLDQPYNQFPSLHISLGFISWYVVRSRLGLVGRLFAVSWLLAIFVSTLLVYQHHAIDLVGGAIMVFVLYWLIPERAPSELKLNFVTPRHLHMALRYLIVATIAVVIAFNTGSDQILISMLFGWIAASLLLVSGSYVLGANGFLRKRREGYAPLIWLLYWPYLLGSDLNWRYWRTRVPLMSKVAVGIWIGARPGRRDWEEIGGNGISSVVDLVPELAGTTPSILPHTHIPLLDIAIPDPAILDKIARQIDECVEKGGVYVYCALGMSRSVLAVCAWLIRNGSTTQEALEVLDRARPERVTRPYIAISLELYEDYLCKIAITTNETASA